MKAKRGQVAIVLVLVLLGLALLVVANVNVFLAVRAKNRMMNAVDESAVAIAKRQGELLNQIGWMNVDHLRAAVLGPDEHGDRWYEEGSRDPEDNLVRMRDLALIRPMEEGADAGNQMAEAWGFSGGGAVGSDYGDHLNEIQSQYPTDYSEYRDGLWADYAQAFSRVTSGTIIPAYMETASAWTTGGPLLSEAFYDAIAARAWCWFTIGGRMRFLDGTPPPLEHVVQETFENSEVYSLHVTFKTWLESEWANEYTPGAGFSERWTNFVCRVTGLSESDFSDASYVDDLDEVWAFYDDYWRPWSQTFNPDNFPIAGPVKPQYDVAGCAASCLMIGDIPQVDDEDGRYMLVSAEAKPLGTVEDLDGGGQVPVTAYHRFIAPSAPKERIFTEAQLVLMGSVPRAPGVSMTPRWYEHVRHHLTADGVNAMPGCPYCKLLTEWENGLKLACRQWLEANAGTCQSKGGKECKKGGYDCAH